jgi:uncharacterized membrane protein YhhN
LRAVLLTLALIAALAYLAGLGEAPAAWQLAVKPMPVFCLALAVALRSGRAYDRFVAGGLLLSSLGDLALELPGGFVLGLGLFLCAHVVYTTAFVLDERSPRLVRLLPFAAYGVIAFGLFLPGLGSLAVPVAAYVTAIVVMMWRAASRLPGLERGARFAFVGAILFAASDTLLGLDRFRAPVAGVRYAILPLYWLGQLAIAASAAGGPRVRTEA